MKEFWVVYDYGMGGVWGVAEATSKEAIVDELAMLTVFEDKPEWISAEDETRIRTQASFVIGEPGTYPDWLRP